MKIVFLSNYFNHHQKPFSDSMNKTDGVEYRFIETEEMESERKNMGWGEKNYPDYVIKSYESEEKYDESIKAINEADVVIFGSAPYKMIKNRLKAGKLVFRYSERLYKKGFKFYEQPLRFLKYFCLWGRFRNTYLLCSSAYAYADYLKTFNFKNRAYNWGYFPEVKTYPDIKSLIKGKEKNSLLWVARLIEWKHPEAPLYVAERLKKDGYDFKLRLIGNGEKETETETLIKEKGLSDSVELLGAMAPEKVREYMEKSGIFMFTSDFNEGWGAVLNESMNSGCAVVASHAIGSVPFLIKDNENGLIYRNGDSEDLYKKVKFLLDNPEIRDSLGEEAYFALAKTWNAEVAAKRIVTLIKDIMSGNKNPHGFEEGPCSKAKKLKNNWYK